MAVLLSRQMTVETMTLMLADACLMLCSACRFFGSSGRRRQMTRAAYVMVCHVDDDISHTDIAEETTTA